MSRITTYVPPIGDLLAVDPAINNPGAALFRGGVLVSAERVKIDAEAKELPILARATRVGADIVRWAMARNAEPKFLVVEFPQIYRATHQRAAKQGADPNDLLALAAVAGAIAGILQIALVPRDIAVEVLDRTPAEWAGQLPKAKNNATALDSPRARRILSRLTDDELAIVPRSHDALDAIGLGLEVLGRLEPIHVYPGAADYPPLAVVPDPTAGEPETD